MRARLVTVAILATFASIPLVAAPAWAGDPDGQYDYSAVQASGGTLTVQAGHTYWTPPANSQWASAARSDPPSGKPNPNQPYGCTYVADPAAQAALGAGGPIPGVWMVVTCSGPGAVDPMPPMWVTNATVAAVQINPVLVAQQAVRQLGFASPTIEMAPPSGSAQLVGIASWLWIAPGAWQTLTASASAGPVTTTATATPSKVVWDMGNGDSVTCDGPGTPYSSADPNASTDCSYTWPQAGSYTVSATVYWLVSWTAAGAAGGGNLGLQAGPVAAVPVTVTESQAINTPTGGSD